MSKVNDFPLPGEKAHLIAAPSDRQNKISSKENYIKPPKKAAVLLYCYPKMEVMNLSLIKRTEYTGVHSGQISFPGGKLEPEDKSLKQTALRECQEELGIQIFNENFMELTPIYIPPSNFIVSPFITFDNFQPKFNLDRREVASLIELPISKLIELKIEKRFIEEGPLKGIEVPCFMFKKNFIWGATAMILSEFKFFLASPNSN